MIRHFRHKGLRRLYERDERRLIRSDLVQSVREILTVLDSATGPEGVDLPGLRLHPLKGDRKGLWSVTVRANWRIVFRFEEGHVVDVDLVDYH